MTDTLKSMRNRGDFRGRKRLCSNSLNLKKYELINYYTYKYIEFCIEWLTHKQDFIKWREAIYQINLHWRIISAKEHQNIEKHNFWKDLFNIIK